MSSVVDIIRYVENGEYNKAYSVLENNPRLIKELMDTLSNAHSIFERILISHILDGDEIITDSDPIIQIAFNGKLPDNVLSANTITFIKSVESLLKNNEYDKALEYIKKYMKYVKNPENTLETVVTSLLVQHKITPERIEQLYKDLGLSVPERLERIIHITEYIRNLENNKEKLVRYIEEKVGEKLKELADKPLEELVEQHPEVLKALGLTDKQIEQLRALVKTDVHTLLKKLYSTLENINKDNVVKAVELLLKVKRRLDSYKDKLGEIYVTYSNVLHSIAEKLSPVAIYILVSKGEVNEAKRFAHAIDKEFNTNTSSIVEALQQMINITPEQAVELVEG